MYVFGSGWGVRCGVRGMGLGFTNHVGTRRVCNVCLCCGGVGGLGRSGRVVL